MTTIQSNTLVFITRIWIEPREIENGTVIWRGVVEVIGNQGQQSTGKQSDDLPLRQAFADLEELNLFLMRHLEQLGIPVDQLRPRR